MKKKIIVLSLLIALSYFLYWGYKRMTDGFHPGNICFPKECETYTLPPQDLELLNTVVKQHFSYLGKGRQCYVFESEDGKWVIKFFKCRRLGLASIYEYIASIGLFTDIINAKRAEKNDRRQRLFMSAYLVATRLYHEAGIAYFQLTPSGASLPTLAITNSAGQNQTIDLNTTPFCIQRKGEHIFPTIARLVDANQIEEAKKRLDQLLAILVEKRKKGVSQCDVALVTRGNVGYIEDRALFLDIGSFKLDKSTGYVHEKRQMQPLIVWLESRNKELASWFKQRVYSL